MSWGMSMREEIEIMYSHRYRNLMCKVGRQYDIWSVMWGWIKRFLLYGRYLIAVDIQSWHWALYNMFSSVQSLSCVRLFVTLCTAAQASLSIINSWSSPKLMSIESVMPSSHLILCRPLFLLPLIPPSVRVFSNESTLRMRWPKYWCFSFSISLSNEYSGLIFFRMDCLDLQDMQLNKKILG